MKIDTIFEPGDKVWTMRDNKAQCFTVLLVKTFQTERGRVKIEYRLELPFNESVTSFETQFVFADKASLIASL